jgi:hypothetical protein
MLPLRVENQMSQQTVSIDFDGVIHSYVTGWSGECVLPDPPVAGAVKFIGDLLVSGYQVVILSTRARSPEARHVMRSYMIAAGLDAEQAKRLVITNVKMPALLYIDDRGFRFEGVFPSMEVVEQLASSHWWLQPEPDTNPQPYAVETPSSEEPKHDSKPKRRKPKPVC